MLNRRIDSAGVKRLCFAEVGFSFHTLVTLEVGVKTVVGETVRARSATIRLRYISSIRESHFHRARSGQMSVSSAHFTRNR